MRAFVVASCGMAMALGCGGRSAAPRRPADAEYLAAIVVQGNSAIPDDALVPGLSLERTRKGGRAIDPYQLSIDTQRIRAAYVQAGFFDVKVTTRVDLRGREQTAVFIVDEGTRATLQVVIRGLPPEVRKEDARALVELPDGAPFDYEVYDAAKQPMLTLVEDAGYPHVRLDAAVLADRDTGIATARYAIEPGPRARFGQISITGAPGGLIDAIRGRLAFRTGDVFSATAIADSQQALYELARFSTVRIDIDRTSGAVVPVTVAVTPGSRHELMWAIGGGAERVWGHARGRLRGFLIPEAFPLWTLSADLRPGLALQWDGTELQQRHRATVGASRIDLFRPRLRGDVSLAIDYLAVEAYTSTGPRLRVGLESPLGVPWLYARGAWIFEYLTFLDPKVDEPVRGELGLDSDQRRGAFEVSLTAEGRDDPVDARTGWFASVRATKGAAWAGGAFDYWQLTPEVRGYFPLGGVVAAARLRMGGLFGDVPVTERYYAGGANSHRGFAERRLSPKAPGMIGDEPGLVVIGGTALLETGVEFRIPIGTLWEDPFGTQLFLDGGDVTLEPEDLDIGNLYWAAGVGIYWKLFGLKFRGDVGYLFTRNEPGFWSNVSPHLGVGDAF
jgi:translocation and assembly module TamA